MQTFGVKLDVTYSSYTKRSCEPTWFRRGQGSGHKSPTCILRQDLNPESIMGPRKGRMYKIIKYEKLRVFITKEVKVLKQS